MMVDSDVQKLIENNVDMQRLILKLVESNAQLGRKMDNLVGLFEEAAKNVSSGDAEEMFNLNKKINELMEQNRQLARGLVLMEDKVKNTSRFQPRSLSRL